jgi:hypothetical protein
MIPKQTHNMGRGSRENKFDKSKSAMSSKRNTGGEQQATSMAKRPQGRAVIMPGGRDTYVKGYPGV